MAASQTKTPTLPDNAANHELEAAAPEAETTIEAGDDTASNADTGYGTEDDSYASTSLHSSVKNYNFEHGRRYHKYAEESAYILPNDEAEQDREDMKHAMFAQLCEGKLHYAPLENPQQILDIGTGTGIWAIDMGDAYPSAAILGNDLSPIQPPWVPSNVRFMVDDFESGWLHGDNVFDYVHGRSLIYSIKDMPKLLSEAFRYTSPNPQTGPMNIPEIQLTYDDARRSLKPGGYLELQDMYNMPFCDDDTMPKEGYPVQEFADLCFEGIRKLGPDPGAVTKGADALRAAGFVNVQEKILKIPIGIWPKDKKFKLIGAFCRTIFVDGLDGIGWGTLGRGLGWSPDQVRMFLVDVKKAIETTSIHSYFPYYIVYGQKPLDASG